MSNEEGETRQELDTKKPKPTDPGNKVITSPRGAIRAAFIIKSKNELKNQELAKQEKEHAKQNQKMVDLDIKAFELNQKIITAPHNDKFAKELAQEMTQVSSQFFQQLKIDGLTKLSSAERDKLAFFELPNTPFRGSHFYTNFINHLEQSIEKNCKVLEGEGKQLITTVPKSEAFDGLHFWHKVLVELQKNQDNFSSSLVLSYLINRNMSLSATNIEGKTANVEYYKKYPEEKVLFNNLYDNKMKMFDNIKNQEDMIKFCVGQPSSIPSSLILNKIIIMYESDKQKNKHDILVDQIHAYQILALQSSYFAFKMDQLDANIKKYTNENNHQALKPLLLEMQDIQQKALETIDERIKKCDALILRSDHLKLPVRYKEMSDLIELKAKIIQQQKVNITNMKLWNVNNKEDINNKENLNFPSTDKINTMIRGNIQEYLALEERKNEVASKITTLATLEKLTTKMEELRVLPYKNKMMTMQDLDSHYNLFRQEIAEFKKTNLDVEMQSPKTLFQHALGQAIDDLLKIMDDNLNHGKIQILARPGIMQEQINKLTNDYEKHMNNLNNEKLMPEAIKGLQDARERLAFLMKVIEDPNFNVKSDIKEDLKGQLKAFKAEISPKVETTAKHEIESAPPEPKQDVPQIRSRGLSPS